MIKELTGWHVLAIFVTGFAIIIGVNLTMAFQAVSTFPGLETRNSYMVSQLFDEERDAQVALGWDVRLETGGDQLTLYIDDEIGPVVPTIKAATLGRATHVGDDMIPVFRHDGTRFVATIPPLAPGNWNLRLAAVAPDGTDFRQRVVLRVRP
ncbi:FixH family protein [Tateyamaria omphalii]|uniref:Nitrogen fixation protein FixH n=1 Tax=Tateyamaria omphalii TaxID=299262 RepID=A0A1P8MRU4_9RHOB|nr:FixH family protein [Tateyamaria omphalii]APX10768.1 nitrogen fixation protein FixH [Tateyamaria omphalii]